MPPLPLYAAASVHHPPLHSTVCFCCQVAAWLVRTKTPLCANLTFSLPLISASHNVSRASHYKNESQALDLLLAIVSPKEKSVNACGSKRE